MFGLLKWIIIFLFIGSVWVAYDVFSNMRAEEKHILKKDTIEAIDGNSEALKSNLREKIRYEIKENPEGILYKLKQKLRSWIDSWGEDEATPSSSL